MSFFLGCGRGENIRFGQKTFQERAHGGSGEVLVAICSLSADGGLARLALFIPSFPLQVPGE